VTHPLAGHFPVEDSARLIRHYRYAAERMMRILGGWIALTPELSAKLLMGRHVWDNAQHCDAWGRRLPELRAPAQVSEPPNSAFVAFMDALESPERPEQTVERVVGVYRVLKPHLLSAYQAHLAQANAVYEPPTRRILARCAEDERRHIAAGEVVLRHLLQRAPLEPRALAWQRQLEALLKASGGVTGQGLPAAVRVKPAEESASLSDDAEEFIRLEQIGRGWSVPHDLQSALEAFGGALVAGDPASARRWLVPGAAWNDAIEPTLERIVPRSHRLVAFSKIGRQCVVKIRLEGQQGAVTITARWAPSEAGWCAAAVELATSELAQPA
jgi:hypothetical protein